MKRMRIGTVPLYCRVELSFEVICGRQDILFDIEESGYPGKEGASDMPERVFVKMAVD